ncbi:uncharacterized protein LOC126767314, partial [Bactrocera neohumeralis]|uniref:uncharacterized protein LOC126767314 n=1 Tax=Bactrocera neohumeralis TaxID=98809 RepID=UPI002165E6C3
MIGRADIEGSKSDVAMNAWPPQASYPCEGVRITAPPPLIGLRSWTLTPSEGPTSLTTFFITSLEEVAGPLLLTTTDQVSTGFGVTGVIASSTGAGGGGIGADGAGIDLLGVEGSASYFEASSNSPFAVSLSKPLASKTSSLSSPVIRFAAATWLTAPPPTTTAPLGRARGPSLLPLATRVTTFAAPSFATPTPLPTVLDGRATLPLPLPSSLRDDPIRAAAFTVVATKALPPQHPLPPSTPPTLRGDPARATTFSAEATLALPPPPAPSRVPPTLRGDPAR